MQTGEIGCRYDSITTGLENSVNLFDEPICLGQVLKHLIGMNDIKALCCQGQDSVQIRLADSDSSAPGPLRSLL